MARPSESPPTNTIGRVLGVFEITGNRACNANPRANDGEKIEYLKRMKTCINGEAARIINHLDATHESYKTCYDLFKKRYDNKRELLGKLIDNMLKIPRIKNESAEALESMHDAVYESIMSIENLGISIVKLIGTQ